MDDDRARKKARLIEEQVRGVLKPLHSSEHAPETRDAGSARRASFTKLRCDDPLTDSGPALDSDTIDSSSAREVYIVWRTEQCIIKVCMLLFE